MIPSGYRLRGDGYGVTLRVAGGVGKGDAMVSGPSLPGPFLVVSVIVVTPAGPATVNVLVSDAAVDAPFVADRLLQPVGRLLIEHGPPTEIEVGGSDVFAVGPEASRAHGETYWPWYVHPRGGVLVLWLRDERLFAAASAKAHVSVWGLIGNPGPLERGARRAFPPRRGRLVS